MFAFWSDIRDVDDQYQKLLLKIIRVISLLLAFQVLVKDDASLQTESFGVVENITLCCSRLQKKELSSGLFPVRHFVHNI